MRFVFVMDALDRVTHDKDTTFAFIDAAQRAGHESFHCLAKDVGLRPCERGVEPWARTQRVEIVAGRPPSIQLTGEPQVLSLRDVDAVLIRKDPPFDQEYLYLTLALEHARGGPVVMNDPRGLRDANEKLYAMHFSEWMPTTIVTSDRDAIHDFVRDQGGQAVIKPLDGAGGSGVMLLRSDDKNVKAIADALTAEGTRLAMVQAFVPDVSTGDKRIILLDGKPLGAILRVPQGGDLRSNIHVGGKVVPAELTAREHELIDAIAPRLRADGLFFVGLDVIGEHLTEVNVTSPTGIQELGRFEGRTPSDDVIAWIEARRRQAAD